jgi:hypothetical protein
MSAYNERTVFQKRSRRSEVLWRWVGRRVAIGAVLCSIASAAFAEAQEELSDAARLSAIVRMLEEMAPESRRASARIRSAYRRELRSAISDRDALIASLESGELARLPAEAVRFNLDLRLAGDHPIAERDLVYQPLYVAARPAALGALAAVSTRVRSGRVEVTSLVRHYDYQRALSRTNPNAATTVPTHTMGLAFDISLLNTPLDTAFEIRDVLRAMSESGELFVIAETHQLVFHVVPAPEYLGYFEALYHSFMLLLPDGSGQQVVVADAATN